MAYQWRDSEGVLCWWNAATMAVFVDGQFFCLAQSESEAKSKVRGF